MEWQMVVRALGALLVVTGLIALCAWLAKRFKLDKTWGARSKATGAMEVLDVLQLDPRRKLMLVRCGDRAELILLSPQSTLVVANNLPLPKPHDPTA